VKNSELMAAVRRSVDRANDPEVGAEYRYGVRYVVRQLAMSTTSAKLVDALLTEADRVKLVWGEVPARNR
jgi:hypothetical protein